MIIIIIIIIVIFLPLRMELGRSQVPILVGLEWMSGRKGTSWDCLGPSKRGVVVNYPN